MRHQVTRQAHVLGYELDLRYYRVDLAECRNTEPPSETFHLANDDMHAPAINRTARVAILVAPDDRSNDFVETACWNAGLTVAPFRDRATAERHLRNSGLITRST